MWPKKGGFELQKTWKFLDSNSDSQGSKNACGKVVYEEVHCIFTVTVFN